MFFKAESRRRCGIRGGAHAHLLGSRRPDCVPPLLAVDLERGWMLMADAGRQLRDADRGEREPDRAGSSVLPLYAGVQIDLIGRC